MQSDSSDSNLEIDDTDNPHRRDGIPNPAPTIDNADTQEETHRKETMPDRRVKMKKHTSTKYKKNDNILFKSDGDAEWAPAIILGRAGKANAANKNWFNVQAGSENFAMDFSKFQIKMSPDSDSEIEVLQNDPRRRDSIHVDISDSESEDEEQKVLFVGKNNVVFTVKSVEPETQKARLDEIEKLKEFGTFSLVPNSGQKYISTRWVDKIKDSGEHKSRLVARGFEERVEVQSDSPTISRAVIRIFITICATYDWGIRTTDIKSAFLQGQEITRDVYVKPPSGYVEKGHLWKLHKCLYGLNDAARQFYNSIKASLAKLGCESTSVEPALFI